MSKERFCIECGSWIPESANPRARVCSDVCREELRHARTATPASRHKNLIRVLEKERCPRTDPLWSEHYYTEILGDLHCLYCECDLTIWSPSGIALDRVQNSLNGRPVGHTAANVIGPVCADCNSIRGNVLTVDEMFILKPSLILIRELRELKKPKRRK
jgi:predicted nucleic acid-binding Zn ribbon protein